MSGRWQVKPLQELCSLFDDGDWIESKDQSDEGIRLIQTGNVGVGQFKDRAEKARYISEDTFARLKCTEIVEGDCLVSRLPDPVGRACIIPDVGEKMITAVDCTIIRFKRDKISADFFNYYAQSHSYLSSVESLITGATRQRISRSNLGQVSIPVPPLPEQKRIVAVLDEAFAGIATATDNAKKNLQNARELFESHLQSIFTTKGDGWVEKKLGEVCDFLNGYAFKSSDAVPMSDTQLIRMGNLYQSQLDIERRAVYYPNEFATSYKKFVLQEGDLIISLTGTTGKEDYGFTVRIPKTEKTLLLNQRIAKIVVLNPKETSADYLLHYLLSRTFLSELYKAANGTRQANLSTDKMKDIVIRIPSFSEQQHIVTQLNALATETKRLEAIYQQKLDNLVALKQSILQKAFAGGLHTDKLAA